MLFCLHACVQTEKMESESERKRERERVGQRERDRGEATVSFFVKVSANVFYLITVILGEKKKRERQSGNGCQSHKERGGENQKEGNNPGVPLFSSRLSVLFFSDLPNMCSVTGFKLGPLPATIP